MAGLHNILVCDFPEHDEAIGLLREIKEYYSLFPSIKEYSILKKIDNFFEKYKL